MLESCGNGSSAKRNKLLLLEVSARCVRHLSYSFKLQHQVESQLQLLREGSQLQLLRQETNTPDSFAKC